MFLSKWYMDCVADNGDLCIGNVGSIGWRHWRLNYASTLVCSGDNVQTQSTFRDINCNPTGNEQNIYWESRKLQTCGTWSARAAGTDQVLFDSTIGSIRWKCLQPSSMVDLHSPLIGCLSGKGYIEQLEMTIKPWRLPINELRWGRFVSEKDYVVWINWRGEHPQTLIIHNGTVSRCGSVSDYTVEINHELTLEMTSPLLLRNRYLGPAFLRRLPVSNLIPPANMARIHEYKCRSRGTLMRKSRPIGEGWVIHEEVRFR